jgi:hypothetical protein
MEHHPSYTSLYQSGQEGCGLCALLSLEIRKRKGSSKPNAAIPRREVTLEKHFRERPSTGLFARFDLLGGSILKGRQYSNDGYWNTIVYENQRARDDELIMISACLLRGRAGNLKGRFISTAPNLRWLNSGSMSAKIRTAHAHVWETK